MESALFIFTVAVVVVVVASYIANTVNFRMELKKAKKAREAEPVGKEAHDKSFQFRIDAVFFIENDLAIAGECLEGELRLFEIVYLKTDPTIQGRVRRINMAGVEFGELKKGNIKVLFMDFSPRTVLRGDIELGNLFVSQKS